MGTKTSFSSQTKAPEPQRQEPLIRLDPGLYIIATPIGNLRDITLRALDVLDKADLILAEDTRLTRKLLQAYGMTTRLKSYHEHNAERERPDILKALEKGASYALVSDAGTPLISDPGYKLVREAQEKGLRIIPLPGPSACLAALMGGGLPTHSFLFAGFLPPRQTARRRFLHTLESSGSTLVFFETGSRLRASLEDMLGVFGEREAVIAREMTKTYETFLRGSLTDLREACDPEHPFKGEITLLVGASPKDSLWDVEQVDEALTQTLKHKPVKGAAAEISALSGWSRREVYARALKLRNSS